MRFSYEVKFLLYEIKFIKSDTKIAESMNGTLEEVTWWISSRRSKILIGKCQLIACIVKCLILKRIILQ